MNGTKWGISIPGVQVPLALKKVLPSGPFTTGVVCDILINPPTHSYCSRKRPKRHLQRKGAGYET